MGVYTRMMIRTGAGSAYELLRRDRSAYEFASSLTLRRDLPSSDYGMAGEMARESAYALLRRDRWVRVTEGFLMFATADPSRRTAGGFDVWCKRQSIGNYGTQPRQR